MRLLLSAVVVFGALSGLAAPRKSIGDAKEEAPCPDVWRDVQLLRALQWAWAPAPIAVRVQAIEDLGFLQDPRAIDALGAMAFDANQHVALAAVRAVAAIPHPRAEEVLGNVLRAPNLSPTLRVRALSLLPFQNTGSALRQVHAVTHQLGYPAEVLTTARRLAAQLPNPPHDTFAGETP